ncbi:hypothetical protein SAMN05421741_11466 [Paenimyroides ummariense]|uniref:Uncharacterized protein n=1 Tax=Paenimyroides ummariense TaxID=913024 RepID=A0A1I5D428_9FLAO|nr:hypothetical protein [Paenimyroides ummariense]SFN94004.1 hypothetical protein SAMN05421741_11466 [Paenimyroides ummariense]
MKKDIFEHLSTAQLIKRRDLLKGVAIGLGIVAITAIGILMYIFITNGVEDMPFTSSAIPALMPLVFFLPMIFHIGKLNTEIKRRNQE